MRLAATEYDRFLEVVQGLDASDWSRDTCCPGWDVRTMTGQPAAGMAQRPGRVDLCRRPSALENLDAGHGDARRDRPGNEYADA